MILYHPQICYTGYYSVQYNIIIPLHSLSLSEPPTWYITECVCACRVCRVLLFVMQRWLQDPDKIMDLTRVKSGYWFRQDCKWSRPDDYLIVALRFFQTIVSIVVCFFRRRLLGWNNCPLVFCSRVVVERERVHFFFSSHHHRAALFGLPARQSCRRRFGGMEQRGCPAVLLLFYDLLPTPKTLYSLPSGRTIANRNLRVVVVAAWQRGGRPPFSFLCWTRGKLHFHFCAERRAGKPSDAILNCSLSDAFSCLQQNTDSTQPSIHFLHLYRTLQVDQSGLC